MGYFGSDAIATLVQTTLAALPAVTGALADGANGIIGATTAPFPAPVLIHYPESLPYAGAVGSDLAPNAQSGRYVVRLICEGWSNEPIRAAAEAMATALDGLTGTVDGTWVRLDAIEEWPNRSYIETVGGVAMPHRELGIIFRVELTAPDPA